ncbi:hypothetical protein HAX54_021637 [Datura stramonium]|uniref:Uncharacterized protein n=1 Tax=Datura stramonium TaxID=4076 RepID=A0ABS8RJK9_DATST|nr:hypothetical protein [Datura stramonium]
MRFNHLCMEALRYAEEGAVSVETYDAAVSALRDGYNASHFNLNDGGLTAGDLNQPTMTPVAINHDDGLADNVKSIAYISQQLSLPANRVAVINLKLQDSKTPSGETEVKFQVSRDTLGSMLRSMAYIREQL